ncbi:Ypk2p [Rhizophagus irregularis DAOM 197198w]|uniref:Ypk2p n=1 Tax=Rhizophagus irregularis (strain DAOM 197198w) TaxID=1432141 RepID=A0A015IZ40_RHIIW|nr:Ypk2p [Rhizophagus irregularis DAOM 197198w]
MSSSQQKQTKVNKKKLYKYKKCSECNKKRRILDESHQLCYICYNIKTILKPKKSGNKDIDDFIRYTQSDSNGMAGKMEFVPYDQFKNIEFIASGGFSKIYKATWVNGPINNWYENEPDGWNIFRNNNYTVVLKKLNNSKNITSKELNELKVFYQIYSNRNVLEKYNIARYFGITQDPITKDIMIIMTYYKSGDLIRYLSSDFYRIDWEIKLDNLSSLIVGLKNLHNLDLIHRDLHSGNIFFEYNFAYIGDLGISRSATESTDNNENYGIIPYMAPEIFQGQKYSKASDICSFGMIMWEFMTGRRPFWDRNHDAELIIEIFDGLRPPIVTNAPKGYIKLMKECWDFNPEKTNSYRCM